LFGVFVVYTRRQDAREVGFFEDRGVFRSIAAAAAFADFDMSAFYDSRTARLKVGIEMPISSATVFCLK
jgi:hypothetical protein